MATIPPTASTLRSWEEAFNHPLPVVRKLETQLRTNIAENQNKLRSLVGASYRDLLGTAERIIEMDAQMQLVESNLSGIGRQCDYGLVERGTRSLDGIKKAGKGGEVSRLETAARVKLLKGALDAVERGVRKSGDAFAAAKLLVLARLLLKSVSESGDAQGGLEELRARLAALRKLLLAYIERALARTTGDRASIANTLCAYAMVTSSAPKDVLRHFLQVRYEQLETKAETPTENSVLAMLEGYGRTQMDTRELFPRRFAETLTQLSKSPLLQDAQVTSTVELNLDIYGRWIPDDIRTFTPWVRHDQLAASEANEGLKSWAKQAQKLLLQGVDECLLSMSDAKSVLSARQRVLSRYMAVCSKLRSADMTQSIDDLRQAFSKRFEQLVSESATIPPETWASLEETARDPQAPIWDVAESSIDTSNGALALRHAVVSKRHGREGTIQAEHEALDRWVSQLGSHWEFIAEMRATKWDDDLDFDVEDLDYEEDDSLADVLSKRDPANLEAYLRAATAEALRGAYKEFEQASAASQNAAVLVRSLREVDACRHVLGDRVDETVFDNAAVVSDLHSAIAKQTSQAPVQALLVGLGRSRRVATMLWDGSPPLPVQPSVSVYRFMTDLQRSMAGAGEDLWSAAAVRALKLHLCDSLEGIEQLPSTPTDPATLVNGHGTENQPTKGDDSQPPESENSKSGPDSKDPLLQRTFDSLYLARVLSAPVDSKLHQSTLKLSKAADLDEAAQQRLTKSANEYWKRTHLLFGLLAAQST